MFQVRVIAYDTKYPDNSVMTDVTVVVTRNANAPKFSRLRYSQRISETFPIGNDILTVEATDQDGVSSITILNYNVELFRKRNNLCSLCL